MRRSPLYSLTRAARVIAHSLNLHLLTTRLKASSPSASLTPTNSSAECPKSCRPWWCNNHPVTTFDWQLPGVIGTAYPAYQSHKFCDSSVQSQNLCANCPQPTSNFQFVPGQQKLVHCYQASDHWHHQFTPGSSVLTWSLNMLAQTS
jgi:hypothetical protein